MWCRFSHLIFHSTNTVVESDAITISLIIQKLQFYLNKIDLLSLLSKQIIYTIWNIIHDLFDVNMYNLKNTYIKYGMKWLINIKGKLPLKMLFCHRPGKCA